MNKHPRPFCSLSQFYELSDHVKAGFAPGLLQHVRHACAAARGGMSGSMKDWAIGEYPQWPSPAIQNAC